MSCKHVSPGIIVCDLSHYFGYCQATTKRGEQCKQFRANGDDLYCSKHRSAMKVAEDGKTVSLAKDKPIINKELMALMHELIVHCEFPIDGLCDGPLECCHVRARGIGGGRRKDVPENLFIACQYHHRKYDGMGQSRKNQEWVKRNVIWKRMVWVQERLQEFSSRADGER